MGIYFEPTIYPIILNKRSEYFKLHPEAKEAKYRKPIISARLKEAFRIQKLESNYNKKHGE